MACPGGPVVSQKNLTVPQISKTKNTDSIKYGSFKHKERKA